MLNMIASSYEKLIAWNMEMDLAVVCGYNAYWRCPDVHLIAANMSLSRGVMRMMVTIPTITKSASTVFCISNSCQLIF